MYTLGVGFSPHDRSCCLVKDGEVRVAIEEERLTRIKHATHYDQRQYRLATEADYFDRTIVPSVSLLQNRLNMMEQYVTQAEGIASSDIDVRVASNLVGHQMPQEWLVVPHHLAHAAHAFFSSPFSHAAIVVVDGAGELCGTSFETVSIYEGQGSTIRSIQKTFGTIAHRTNTIIALSHSIGVWYQNASAVCGFGPFGTGKLMGLAPYGSPRFVPELRRFMRFGARGVWIDNLGAYRAMRAWVHPHSSQQRRADVAASVQFLTNRAVAHVARLAVQATGCRQVCLSGGVALNAVTNSFLVNSGIVDEVYVPSAPGDNGVAMGAALYIEHVVRKLPHRPNAWITPYLGRSYSAADVRQAIGLHKEKLHVRRVKGSLVEQAAKALANGRVIGWFQGGSEIGPRALGHRSILAAPFPASMRDRLNTLKQRENFRPIAPAVLAKDASRFYKIPKTMRPDAFSYMVFVLPEAHHLVREHIPAAIHVDGTSRIQTVTPDQDALYHQLVSAFAKRSGIPVLLNTSFNVGDEPIVETPQDALKTFLNFSLDDLFIGSYHLTKTPYARQARS